MRSMRITSWNVNGLRAALKKGFAEEVDRLKPDVLLLQEVLAFPAQLPDGWGEDGTPGDAGTGPSAWTKHFHPAEKPGYAGVAVFTRGPSTVSLRGVCGPRQKSVACPEGRVLGVTLAASNTSASTSPPAPPPRRRRRRRTTGSPPSPPSPPASPGRGGPSSSAATSTSRTARTTSTTPSRTGSPAASSPTSAPGSATPSSPPAGVTSSAAPPATSKAPTAGGATAARPAPSTAAGASTTCSPTSRPPPA